MKYMILTLTVLALTFGMQAQEKKPTTGKTASRKKKEDKLPLYKLKPPFAPGEKLTYDLKWNKIAVGQFTVSVVDMTESGGEPAWHFVFEARTNSVADKIYKVRTYIHSYASKDLRRSIKYVSRQGSGDDKKWVILKYDKDKKTVHYMKNGNDRGKRPVGANAVDPLSMFFLVRSIDLADKETITIRVNDGKRTVDSTSKIGEKEKVETKQKNYEAYLIEPELTGLRGVFKKNKNAKLQIWVSADEDQIPVKIASEVAVGKFYATLSKHERPKKDSNKKTAQTEAK